jgi:hypothetical protein
LNAFNAVVANFALPGLTLPSAIAASESPDSIDGVDPPNAILIGRHFIDTRFSGARLRHRRGKIVNAPGKVMVFMVSGDG